MRTLARRSFRQYSAHPLSALGVMRLKLSLFRNLLGTLAMGSRNRRPDCKQPQVIHPGSIECLRKRTRDYFYSERPLAHQGEPGIAP